MSYKEAIPTDGFHLPRTILSLCLLLLAWPGLGLAGPVDDGLEAYKRGDHAAAAALWRPSAEKGDASAEFYLGLLYRNGQGVPRNEAEATAWLRKSADQGYPPAQYSVARSTTQRAEAFDWYKKAAEQDYAAAQFTLGDIYDFGVLAPRNRAESLKLWRMAAERGYGPAIYRMGMLYLTGDLPMDRVQAFKWFTLALLQPESILGEAGRPGVTMLRNSIGQGMTPEQIAEAQQEAKDWRPIPEAWVEKWRTR